MRVLAGRQLLHQLLFLRRHPFPTVVHGAQCHKPTLSVDNLPNHLPAP